MARTTQSRSQPRKKGGSVWSGIMIGILVGVAAAVAVAVWVGHSNPFAERAATANKAANGKPQARPSSDQVIDPLAKATATVNSPRFDFYKILPGNQNSSAGQTAAKTQAPAAEQFYLQAGAFPNAEDADNLKARLALMGYESDIQTVDIPDKGIWHRVRLGPYKAEDLKKIQANLAQNNINTTLVKIKSPSDAMSSAPK
ncbi:MAG TPA: SPOR domain-containing protein [Burkholderiales bacterium]|nr:SPOR domain-containing protein [Burkholderiales bacterium]